MGKVPFSKLNLKKNEEVIKLHLNEQEVEVRQYLPIADRLNLISNALNLSVDENNFYNPAKLKAYFNLEIVYNYTNIIFTEKQKEDIIKLYDLLQGNHIIDMIIQTIPHKEYDKLWEETVECAKAIYEYKNSAVGIFETISQDYSNLNLDATEIQQKMKDPENLTLLKDVLTKLG